VTLRGHFRKRRYRSQTVWSASFQSPKDAAVRDSLAIMALGLQIHAPQQVGEAWVGAEGVEDRVHSPSSAVFIHSSYWGMADSSKDPATDQSTDDSKNDV
jgi:hypothetical protein